jgi:hypothetical protein
MKVIENNIIPFKGFLAINLFGVVFVRKDLWHRYTAWYQRWTLNHEAIHTAQQKELLYVFFYFLYFLEWIFRLVTSPKTAYRSISFEREAFAHEADEDYLTNRKPFAQWRKH